MSVLQRFKHLSLRWQICLFVGVTLATSLFVLGTLTYMQSRRVVTQLTEERILAETHAATNLLNDTLNETRADCVTTLGYPPIPGLIRCWDNGGNDPDPEQAGSTTEIWIERLAVILSSQMRTHPIRMFSEVYRDDGSLVMNVTANSNGFELATDSTRNISDDVFFQTALKLAPGKVHLSEMKRERSRKELRVGAPFHDPTGKVRGVFVIGVDGEELLRRAANVVTSGWTDIADDTGKFLYCESNREAEFSQVHYVDLYPVRWQRMNDPDEMDSGAEYIAGADRNDRATLIGTYEKIYYDDQVSRDRFWALSPSVLGSEALARADELARRFAMLGLVVMIGAFLVTYIFSGPLTSALRQLTDAADRLAAGALDTELPSVLPIGEVRELRQSIESMTNNLKTMLADQVAEKARTKAILDSTADSIVMMRESGEILFCNAATTRLFGWREHEIVGRNAAVLAADLYNEETQYENVTLAEGESRILGSEQETTGRRVDGSEFPISLRVTELQYAGERLYIATMQDITVRMLAEGQRDNLFDATRQAVLRLATANRQIVMTTNEQASGARQQAAAVAQTVATVNEVAQTASQAAERAKAVEVSAKQADKVGSDGKQAVEEAIAAMVEVREQVELLAENILSLGEKAQEIGKITSTVSDIAEQTNVLALNASVEAARAGEQGKGFAVVANEVKGLAEESKKATTKVRQILEEIQEATNRAVMSTEAGTRSVSTANSVVEKAGDTIRSLASTLASSARSAMQISASASQQAAGVRQLHEGIQNIDKVTRQNEVAIQQIEEAAQNLNALSTELASLTAQQVAKS